MRHYIGKNEKSNIYIHFMNKIYLPSVYKSTWNNDDNLCSDHFDDLFHLVD